MPDTKSVFASRTVWTSLITAGVGVAIAVGLLPEGFDAEPAIGVVTAVLGALSAYFRITADTVIAPKG